MWAPRQTDPVLVIHEDIRIRLTKQEHGYWHAVTDQLKPGGHYAFITDDGKTIPDPASLCQPDGVHAPSQALNITAFPWTDHEWKNVPLEEYILYELHTGTFTADGDFAAIEQKLDHLKILGITAIEIMPVAQFPGTRNWGYDGVYPFAVQYSYGGAGSLQRLVEACHSKGLAVVLDVVYNHVGPEGNYLETFAPYFTDKYKTPWGKAINFDDAGSDGVRRFVIENALMWFRDFHIDTLRLDAIHAIRDFGPVHILEELRQHVDLLMKETGRTHYLIIESDLNDTRFIRPREEKGCGMDAQWIDEFHHALRVATGQEKHGYYSDFDGLAHLAKAYKDTYIYDGIYSPHRNRTFGISAKDRPGKQFVVFSQNHDQVGNRMMGERTSTLVSFEMLKLMAAAVMVSPYLPLLFMGEEWGEPHPFLYFVSHTDPELAEAVRKGRAEEFAEFHAQGAAPDPMAEETFLHSKLQWELIDEDPYRTLFLYYQALIRLRKQQQPLAHLDRSQLDVTVNESRNTLILHRWHKEHHLFCLMNFSKEEQLLSFPTNTISWKKIFDSADPLWFGPAAAAELLMDGAEVRMQPESILIYTNQYV